VGGVTGVGLLFLLPKHPLANANINGNR